MSSPKFSPSQEELAITSPMHSSLLMVDAHVHLHGVFPLLSCFKAAMGNFLQAKQNLAIPHESCHMLLLLTESATDHVFDDLLAMAEAGRGMDDEQGGTWEFHASSDRGALTVHPVIGLELHILAGRQVVTAEKLEVLALMTPEMFPDGRPLLEVVHAVKRAGGIPVIPWGFGKWMGRRGALLRNIIKQNPGDLWLGDNGGRPVFWPRPNFFSLVEQAGGRVLPGSDPLPFPTELDNIANFGFWMQAPFNSETPVLSLKQALRDRSIALHPYGKGESPFRFISNQVAMQRRKRSHTTSGGS